MVYQATSVLNSLPSGAAVRSLRHEDAVHVGVLVRKDADRAAELEENVVEREEERGPAEVDHRRARIGAGGERLSRPERDALAACLGWRACSRTARTSRWCRRSSGSRRCRGRCARPTGTNERARVEHLRHLDRADRARHPHRNAAVLRLERRAREVMPVRGEMEAVLVVLGEAELLGVDAVVVERGDDGARSGRAACITPTLSSATKGYDDQHGTRSSGWI